MKVINKILFVFFAALICVGCSKDEQLSTQPGIKKLQAYYENSEVQTKVGFGPQTGFFWSEGDAISVYTTNNGFETMLLTSGAQEATGSFEGWLVGEPTKYAIYPASTNHALSGNTLKYVFSDSYEYEIEDSEFGQKDGNSFKVAMYARISGTEKLQFKHLGAVYCIQIKDMPVGDGYTLEFVSNNKITGEFSVDLSAVTPVISTQESETENKVTIAFNVTSNSPTRVFYIPVPVGTHKAKIAVKKGDLQLISVDVPANKQTIARKQAKTIILTKKGLEGGADSDNAESALKSAIEAAEPGSTVTLDSDVDLTSPIVIEKDITIDLNGKSIKNPSGDVFVVIAGTLTLQGDGLVYGSEDNSSSSCAVWVKENGKAIINGGTYKVGDDESNKSTGNWRNDCIYARDNGQIEINGGEFMYTGENPEGHTFVLNCRDADYKAGKANIVVKGGKFHNFNPGASNGENPVANYLAPGYSSEAEGECFVVSEGVKNESALKSAIEAAESGSTVTLDSNIDLTSPIVIEKDITIDLNGKSIKNPSGDVFVVIAGTLTLQGNGLVYGSEDNSSSSCAVWVKENGKAIINGGTYKVGDDESNKSTGNWRNDCIYARDNGQIEINGGEFMYTGVNPEGHTFVLNCRDADYKAGKANIVVKGGKFHKFNPGASNGENPVANYLAPGYSSEADGECFVVSEGVKNESALKSAIEAAEPGSTVTLDSDVDLTSPIDIEKDITIDLNGKNIKNPSGDVFVVIAGTLTLQGDGLVYGSEDNSSSSCAVWVKENGKAIINGGTYKVGDDESSKSTGNWRNDCIYARDNGQIEINGGEFMYTGVNPIGHTFLLNCRDADYKAGKANIVVKGGKFHNFNPGASNGENPVANYLAAGYKSTETSENIWTVSAE